MTVAIRVLRPADAALLSSAERDLFDRPVRPEWAAEFLADPRHHLVVATEDGHILGFASGVHYLHPDKPPTLFVNEVGVRSSHQRRGVGQALVAALLAHARSLGCVEGWALTGPGNAAARALFRAAGGAESELAPVMIAFDLDGCGGCL